MLTFGGYPFYRCKTIWEVKDAITERQGEGENSQEHRDADQRRLSGETCVCDSEQICQTEPQEKEA